MLFKIRSEILSTMSQRAKKTTLLASLGAGLEYYDFIVYGMMVVFLNTLFFSSSSPWINQMKAFGVFASGYLARPFGGVVFGMIGDAFGRKKSFLLVMMLMALATLAIGFLPTREQIGSSAAVLLIVCRILQGLSFGAELPGAITVVYEHSEKKERAFLSGFVISSVTLGSLLASLILFFLTQSFNESEILRWGWRIPFLFGGTLAIINAFIRKYLQETPEYLESAKNRSPRFRFHSPLFLLASNYWKQTLLGIGTTLFLSSLVIFVLYLPTYLGTNYNFAQSDIYLAMTFSMAWSALILPVFGYIADRWSPGALFRTATIGFAVLALPIFQLLNFGSFAGLAAFMILYQTLLSAATTSYFPLLSALFPTQSRYTGVALSYNVSYALMGLSPIVLTFLIERFEPHAVVWFLIPCALISALSSHWARR